MPQKDLHLNYSLSKNKSKVDLIDIFKSTTSMQQLGDLAAEACGGGTPN